MSTVHEGPVHEPSAVSPGPVTTIPVSCLERKGGCICRCHTNKRITRNQNRHFFVDSFGLSSLFRSCNTERCNNRRYSLQIRLAASRYGLPLAAVASIEFRSSWAPTFSLTTQTVCRYTSPGFRMLWELERKPLVEYCPGTSRDWLQHLELEDEARCQKVADIKRLFATGEAAFTDVDPAGEGWIEKVLDHPWSIGVRDAQWALIEFLLFNSPERVLANPNLLYKCATWVGEGPHMAMLETLLKFGVDPDCNDAGTFRKWPRFCSPDWYAEGIAPDPMFVEWIRKCIDRSPGFAGCDELTETMLTGGDGEFDLALAHATDKEGILRNTPNVFAQTALHLAITSPRRLTRLLKAGMDPDAVDRGGLTALMYAACYGESESVLCLLEHGARLWLVEDCNSRMFVDYAIRRNHLEVIENVVHTLRRQGSNLAAKRVLDRSLGYYFVNSTCHDIEGESLKRLFALNADPDIHIGAYSLIHLAGRESQRHMLLDNGFTAVGTRDEDGVTPLMIATSKSDFYSIRVLIERGADVNGQDKRGWTALHHLLRTELACNIYTARIEQDDRTFERRREIIACMHLLLKSKADITIRDRCTCACSPDGCSATTVALHRSMKKIGLTLGPQNISGILIDLLCVLQNRMTSSLDTFSHDLTWYRRFLESGLEHTCCYRQRDWLPVQMDTEGIRRSGHVTSSDTILDLPNRTFHRDETVMELAKVFRILETQALEAYNDAVEIELAPGNRGFSTRYIVDEKNDSFTESYIVSMLPPLSKVDINNHQRWFASARKSKTANGLHQRGELQAYIEDALQLLSDIKRSMHSLQLGDNAVQTEAIA